MIETLDLVELVAKVLASFATGYLAGKMIISIQRFGELST